jgi:hypothetical protein
LLLNNIAFINSDYVIEMSNQVIDNPTRRSIACVASSKYPPCVEQDTLGKLIEGSELKDIQEITDCSCPVTIIKDPGTNQYCHTEKTLSTISFPQLSNYGRFRLPNNLSFATGVGMAGYFPLTWRLVSLVIDGVEQVTTPLDSRVRIETQADVRGFDPSGSGGGEGGVVQEVEAFNDFFRRLGLSNAFHASSPTGLNYVPYGVDLSAGFILHWNPCVVTTWFRLTIDRVSEGAPMSTTYTYQVNDPAPPLGASTDQLANGISFSGIYGGTPLDVLTLATNSSLK